MAKQRPSGDGDRSNRAPQAPPERAEASKRSGPTEPSKRPAKPAQDDFLHSPPTRKGKKFGHN